MGSTTRAVTMLRRSLIPSVRMPLSVSMLKTKPTPSLVRQFSATPTPFATYNQVSKGCRVAQRARKAVSPALRDVNAPELKGVCIKRLPRRPTSTKSRLARPPRRQRPRAQRRLHQSRYHEAQETQFCRTEDGESKT